MRRLALSAGALVVAISFSSCSSVDNGNTAAEVNGHRLSNDQLSSMTEGSTNGEAIRETLTTWIEVVAVTDDPSGMATPGDLAARKLSALRELLAKFSNAGQATYELGLDGSPFICLAAIPLDATVAGAKVLQELAAGTAFAEAAKSYSVDETLAASGGVVKGPDGVECIAGDQFNPALVAALVEAEAAVGEPAAVLLQSQEVVILLRPFDELTLSEAERLQLSANDMGAALKESYGAADISVAGRFGRWDGKQARVVATGSPAATVPAADAPAVDPPPATG